MATKLQITITSEEEALLRKKAERLGYNVTKFAKFLLTREAYEEPQLSEWAKQQIKKSEQDYEQGNYTVLETEKDIDKLIDNLQV